MSTATKVIATALVGSGAIGGGVTYALINKKDPISISKQLENEGKKILGVDGSSELWNIKLKTYQKQKATLNIIKLSSEDVGTLKSKCSTNLTSEFNEKNKPLYEALKKVCTVPTYKEKLLSLDKKIADNWNEKANTYNGSAQTDNAIEEFKNVRPNETQIKQWCEKIIEEEFKSDTDKNYKLSIKWCIKGEV